MRTYGAPKSVAATDRTKAPSAASRMSNFLFIGSISISKLLADLGWFGPDKCVHPPNGALSVARRPHGGGAVVWPSQASDFWANNHPQTATAINAPMSCAAMNAGMCAGSMPENVFVKLRANVTAGLAKLVDAVNQ